MSSVIMGMTYGSSPLLHALAVGSIVMALGACAPRIDTRGNLPDPERLAEVKPGLLTRDEVANILGSPSTIATFDEETWYYISKRTETVAFLEPEIGERMVVIVRFDSKGVVSGVETLGVEDGRVVRPVDRKTPTAGNELTILDQLIGNFGRFNK